MNGMAYQMVERLLCTPPLAGPVVPEVYMM